MTAKVPLVLFKCPECGQVTRQPADLDGQLSCIGKGNVHHRMRRMKRADDGQ